MCLLTRTATPMHMPLIMKILAKHSLPTDMDPRILEESTLPSATCIKFKVFTAIFSLHFTKIVFRLFAILGSFVTFASLQQFSRNRRQAWSHSTTHTHTRTLAHTYCAICIVCVFELRRVWFGSLMDASPAPPTAMAATFTAFVVPSLALPVLHSVSLFIPRKTTVL